MSDRQVKHLNESDRGTFAVAMSMHICAARAVLAQKKASAKNWGAHDL